MTIRHPEKINRQTNPIPKKPSWIRVKAPTSNLFKKTRDIIKKNNLKIIDFSINEINGGSVEVICAKKKSKHKSKNKKINEILINPLISLRKSH